jgi:hypothetical protein
MNACTTNNRTGTSGSCNVVCSYPAISACTNGDGCCPAGCTGANDNDCAATTCNLVYDLTPTFRVLGTPLGAGDATRTLPDGRMIVRVQSNAGAPANGTAEILFIWLDLDFSISSTIGSANVVTDIAAFSQTCNGTANPPPAGETNPPFSAHPAMCAYTDTSSTMAIGTFNGTSIAWNACSRHANYNTNSYTTDNSNTSTGTGCLRNYRSVGTVTCTGAQCSLGGLPNGTQTLSDSSATLPLETLTFTNGVTNIAMAQIAIPNERSGRTTLQIAGTRLAADPLDTCN